MAHNLYKFEPDKTRTDKSGYGSIDLKWLNMQLMTWVNSDKQIDPLQPNSTRRPQHVVTQPHPNCVTFIVIHLQLLQ